MVTFIGFIYVAKTLIFENKPSQREEGGTIILVRGDLLGHHGSPPPATGQVEDVTDVSRSIRWGD